MAFGVTIDGFIKKRLADVQVETLAAFQAVFGKGFDMDPRSPEGQIKGILDGRIATLWDLGEAIYFSQYPDPSEGINLDNAVSLTGIVRKNPRSSIVESGVGRGIFGTIIPLGTIISVTGNPDARFVTDAAQTISIAAIDEIQRLDFGEETDGGSLVIDFNGDLTGALASGASAATIEAALEALPSIGVGNVTVTGSFPVNEVQTLSFDLTPDSGSFTITFGGFTTAAIAFGASAAAVESALEALTSIGVGNVSVSGTIDDITGLTIIFQGSLGGTDQTEVTATSSLLQGATPVVITPGTTTPGAANGFVIDFSPGTLAGLPQPQITIPTNTLVFDGAAVSATPSTTVEGDKAKTPEFQLTAEDTGPTVAGAGSLTVIETPVVGLENFTNVEDADIGAAIESDIKLKSRRREELQIAGAATPEAIRSDLLDINDVTAVVVFFNNKSIIDIDGRPPHSADIVVQGGDEDVIADRIFNTVAGGIETIGTIAKVVIDSQGFPQDVNFSRPTDVDIFVEIDLTVNVALFPADGLQQVEDAILAYGNALDIGKPVVVYGSAPSLSCSFDAIPGILDYTIRVSRDSGPPTVDDNISIAAREISDFDSSRITVVTV